MQEPQYYRDRAEECLTIAMSQRTPEVRGQWEQLYLLNLRMARTAEKETKKEKPPD